LEGIDDLLLLAVDPARKGCEHESKGMGHHPEHPSHSSLTNLGSESRLSLHRIACLVLHLQFGCVLNPCAVVVIEKRLNREVLRGKYPSHWYRTAGLIAVDRVLAAVEEAQQPAGVLPLIELLEDRDASFDRFLP